MKNKMKNIFSKLFKSQGDKELNLIRLISNPEEVNSELLRKYKRIIIEIPDEKMKTAEKIIKEFDYLLAQGMEYGIEFMDMNGRTYLDCRRFA